MSIASSKNRSRKRSGKRWIRKSRQRAADRRELLRGLQLESLEQRQLLTGAPMLAGVTTNDNTLLENGEVLRTSPQDLTFHFNRAANLDPSTFGGIEIIGSGNDGLFQSAQAISDFGSNGAVWAEFTAVPDGTAGNGIMLELSFADLGPPASPQVTVSDQTVSVVLNTNSQNPTTAQRLVDSINADQAAQELLTARIMGELNSDPDFNIAALATTTPLQIVLGGSNDITLEPGYVGKGDYDREVVFRFKEALANDSYQVNIFGSGPQALMDVDGSPFNEGEDVTIQFSVDLAPQVLSVVPQPVMQNANGQWEQMSDQIHVYFNDDDLNLVTAESREFYQLMYTRNTVENTDDVVFFPKEVDGVKYYPDADLAVVTFDAPLYSLVDPETGLALGSGTFRFRVGTNEEIPLVPVQIDLREQPDGTPNLDAGDSFQTALSMGTALIIEAGGELVDEGDSFRLTDTNGKTQTFEFDPGFILELPIDGIASSGGIWDGQRFEVGDVTFEFGFAEDQQYFVDENFDSQPDNEIISVAREQGVVAWADTDRFMLSPTASDQEDFYVGQNVEITAGSAAGIVREIVAYNSFTKIATVDAPWGVSLPTPSDRWRFRLYESMEQLTEIVRQAIQNAATGVTPTVLETGKIHLGSVTFEKEESGNPTTNVGEIEAITANSIELVATALPSQVDHVQFQVDLLTEEATGTVPSQAALATEIVLQDHSPVNDAAMVGLTVDLTTGTGAGQVGTIVAYDEFTQTATLDQAWVTSPDVDTEYSLKRSQTRQIVSYDQLTRIATVDADWDLMIDGASLPYTDSSYTIHAAADVNETGISQPAVGAANGGNSIYLETTANPNYGAYAGLTITITGGLGNGQTNTIYSYDGSNRLAVVDTPWITIPDATSTYSIEMGRLRLPLGALKSNSGYWGFQVEITEGTGMGQVRTISHYEGASRVATVTPSWTTPPDATSQLRITTTDLWTTGQPGTQIEGATPIPFVPSAELTPPEVLSQKIAEAISSADFGVRAGVGDNSSAHHVGLVGVKTFDTGPVVAVTASSSSDFLNKDELQITDESGHSAIFRLRDYVSGIPEPPEAGVPVYPVVFYPDMTVEEILTDIVETINNTIDFDVIARLGNLGIELEQDSIDPSQTVSFVPSDESPVDREMPLAIELIEGVVGFDLQQSNSFIVKSSIDPQQLALQAPGAIDEPGHREIRSQRHYLPGFTADSQDGVAVRQYNFQQVYALDTQDRPLYNIITEQQKERAREAFELISQYAGIQFIETENQGITVATGDLQAIEVEEGQQVDRSLLGLGGFNSSGNPVALMDGEDFSGTGTDLYGDLWFQTAIQVILQTVGIGYTDELPPMTLSGDWDNNPGDANPILAGHQGLLAFDPVFPGYHDQDHLQYLYRKDVIDTDMFSFAVTSTGLFTVETIAERSLQASSLDTVLRLYRELTDTDGKVIGHELYAQNDNYFSNDSFIELNLLPGIYYLGVSASGNDRYDPSIERTGYGGTTQGNYELRVTQRPDVDLSIEDDQTGLDLDGDLDGNPGGVHNSWFRTAVPIGVAEARVPGVARAIFVDKTASGDMDGSLQNPYANINDAFANCSPGDVVHILGNRVENLPGTENDTLKALEDIQAYEIGFSGLLGLPLADGPKMQVPQGVTVMVAQGATLKLRRAAVDVGSTDSVVDRSGSALQVMGTPRLLKWNDQWEPVEVHRDLTGQPLIGYVYFTSLHDSEVGQGTNPELNPPDPAAGNWGGLAFNTRIDRGEESRFLYEKEGIFLNSVSFADIRYGGGIVDVDSIPQAVRPIDLTDARPTINFNQIRFSADAAIGSTPNSSEETNFHAPEYQSVPFTSDYSRVGPAINGNRLVENSINGHFIVIATPSSQEMERLTVAGRWDDSGIVTVLSENFIIEGTPGGLIMESEVPPVNLVTLTPLPPGEGVGQGTLRAGTYNYRLVFVDGQGHEGVPSEPTSTAEVSPDDDAEGRIQLANLPPATGNYVARRLYRNRPDGDFERIADLNANDQVYVDDGTTRGGLLADYPVVLSARLNASLVIDSGIIAKFDGSYIDVGFGAQLLAEADATNPIVFTSIRDTRYGRGGTFDTGSQGALQLAPGNWAGIHGRGTSHLSLDNVVVAYAGGVARVEGNFAGFNAVEIHQGQARIANSRFEHNLNGQGGQAPASRYGRLPNDEAVIFVRGSEAVIIDNVMVDNDAAVISVDVNSMNGTYQDDYGRSTGRYQRNSDYDGNQGILVRGNRLERNDLNGIKVREGILNTSGVWDETDMTLVIDGPIYVTDSHSGGGLRLESKVTESLVAKFDGPDAGFVITGMPLDIVDRIGGVLQIIGQPQSPVVLTALADDQVGNGLKLDGTTQKDTDNEQLGFQFENLTTTENDPNPDPLVPWLIDNDVVLTPLTAGQFQYHTGPGGESGSLVDWIDPVTGTALGPYDLGIATAQGRTAMLQRNFIEEFLHFVSLNGDTFNLSNTTIVTPPQKIAFDRVLSEGTFQGNNNAIVNWRVETHLNDGEPIVWNTLTFESEMPLGEMRLISYLDQVFSGIVTDPDISHPGGMTNITYQLAQAPIEVGSVIGEIRVANQIIQTFSQNTNGSFTIVDVSGTGAKVTSLTLNPNTGALAAVWSAVPGAHTLTNVTYQPMAQDILKTIGTPGQSDFRVMTLDNDQRIGIQQGGVYQDGSSGLDNARFIGYAADKSVDLKDRITGANPGLPEVTFSFSDAIAVDQNDLPQFFDSDLGVVYGPEDITTGMAWDVDPASTTAKITTFLELLPVYPVQDLSGAWDGVQILQYSHDRNVSSFSEVESLASAFGDDSNRTAENAQHAGSLSRDPLSANETEHLGLSILGNLNGRSDVDNVSFTAYGATEVWLDIDGTSPSLDTVIELVDAENNLLARSDNSGDETTDPALLNPLAIDYGPVILLNHADGSPTDGSQLIPAGDNLASPTGDRLVITDDQDVTTVFEFTVNGTTSNASYLPIVYRATMDHAQLVRRVVETINETAATEVKAEERHGRIHLTNDHREMGYRPRIFGAPSRDDETPAPLQVVRDHSSVSPESMVGKVNPLAKADFAIVDAGTVNVLDAGMRVILPGEPTTQNEYFVRIRSASGDLWDLDNGRTQGEYKLQIRLGERDEYPGTTIHYADIRNATNGINIIGLPLNSHLTGEAYEMAGNNEDLNNAQDVGNVLRSNVGTISFGGILESATDVDIIKFSVLHEHVTVQDGTVPIAIDVDWSSGLERPSTSAILYDATGNVIVIAEGSNIADDRPRPLEGLDLEDHSRGSVGYDDPFMGPVELPVGDYYLAITHQDRAPQSVYQQENEQTAIDPLLRVQANPFYGRVLEDHVESAGGGTLDPPQFSIIVDVGSFTPYHLGDVVTFVNSEKALKTVNPFTGAWETLADPPLHQYEATSKISFDDIEIHPLSGGIMSFESTGVPQVIRTVGKENIVGAGTYLEFSGDGSALPATSNVTMPWVGAATAATNPGDPTVNAPPVLGLLHGNARQVVPVGQPDVPDPAMAGLVVRAMTFNNFDPRTADGMVNDVVDDYGDERLNVYGLAVASRPGIAKVEIPWYGDPNEPDNPGDQAHRLELNRGLGLGTAVAVAKPIQQAAEGQNEIQQVSVNPRPSSGVFMLGFMGEFVDGDPVPPVRWTASLPWNVTAAEVTTALEGLPGVDPGDVLVTGGPWPNIPFEVEFTATFAETDMWRLVAATSTQAGGFAGLTGVDDAWMSNVLYTFNPVNGRAFPTNVNVAGVGGLPTNICAATPTTNALYEYLLLNCNFAANWGPEQTLGRARGQMDTFADPIGKHDRLLVTPEVTEVSAGNTDPMITADSKFNVTRAVVEADGAVWEPILPTEPDFEEWLFEFNLGPDIMFHHNLESGNFVIDGESFQLGDTLIEFDTGPRLKLTLNDTKYFQDGDLLTITDNQNEERIFEFTSQAVVETPRIKIPLAANLSTEEIINRIVQVVNGPEADAPVFANDFAVIAVPGNRSDIGWVISLQDDHEDLFKRPEFTLTVGSSPTRQPLEVSGDYSLSSEGGPVFVRVEETFTSEQFAGSMISSLHALPDHGVNEDYQVGWDGDRINFRGYESSTLDELLMPWVSEVISQNGNNAVGGVLVIDVLASDSAADVARKVTQKIQDETLLEARSLWGGAVEVGENAVNPSYANNAQQPSDPAVPALGHPDYIIPYIFTNSSEELPVGGAGPGGFITGMASIKDKLYAVSDKGGFFEVNFHLESQRRDDYLTYIPQSTPGLLGKDLQGLTAGPADVELFHLPIEDVASSDPIQVTTTRHGLSEGDQITIEGVEGNTAANGDFTVRNVTTDSFELYELHGLDTPVEEWETMGVRYNGVYAPSSKAFIYELGKTEGPYENMLFAIDANSMIYALNTSGEIQQVFVDAQSSVATTLPDVTAISFSDLGRNLWHFEKELVEEPAVAGGNMSDAGHRYTSYEAFRDETEAGFDQPEVGFENRYIAFSDVQYDMTTEAVIGDQYDFAGGAHGAVETNSFSLLGYSPADQPYLYFDYQIGAADEDAFRVFVGDDSGVWRLLASNQAADIEDDVKQLFNNTTTWRQSRVSLAAYAGRENIRLRFDFNTAADTNSGDQQTTGTALRLVSPAEIPDGELFVFDGVVTLDADGKLTDAGDGRVFEFDRGVTALAASGNSLLAEDPSGQPNRQFEIVFGNGSWLFEFVDEEDESFGNATTCNPTVPLPIVVNKRLTPRQVAQRIEGALVSYVGLCPDAIHTTVPAYQIGAQDPSTGLFEPWEDNDTLDTAFDQMHLVDGDARFTFTGWQIGDNENEELDDELDVDLIRVPLNEGSTIKVDVDTSAETLDSYLRIFDAVGNELASNDVGPNEVNVDSTDSYLEFTAPRTGEYYIGVSAAGNTQYDPDRESSGVSGGTGFYNLTIDLDDSVPRFIRLGAEINIPYAEKMTHVGNEPVDEQFVARLNQGQRGTVWQQADVDSVPIFIHLGMDDREVAQAVQLAIAGSLADDDQDLVKTHNDTVNVIGHEVTYYSDGLGLTVSMPGDPEENEFGVGYYSVDRAMDNAHDGVRLDNLVVGFAETGNIVESGTGATGTMTPQFQGQAELPDVLTGAYQVEIRYVQQEKLEFDHSLDTNQRFSQSKTLEASAGSDLYDGQTFVIEDGVSAITFEYDNILLDNGVAAGHQRVAYDSTYSAPEVARAIWNAVNSPAVQGILDVQAGPANGGLLTDASDRRVNLYGNAVIDVASSALTVDTNATPNQLRDVVLGEGVSAIGNATLVRDGQAGIFSGNRNILGMPSGLILSTGQVTDITQPNSVVNTSGLASLQEDELLDRHYGLSSIEGATTDGSWLEFEVKLEKDPEHPLYPNYDPDLYVTYVYASEEYSDPQSPRSDVMGIFVDDHSDGFQQDDNPENAGYYQNIAVLPGTAPVDYSNLESQVRSSNINGGYPFLGPFLEDNEPANAQYFINNDADQSNPSSTTDVVFDGFTTVLTAAWLEIGAGTHTIRLAVSDVATSDVDSALFVLENGVSRERPTDEDLLGDMLGTRVELKGHRNTERHQGQLVIEANTITNSSGFGIVVDSAPVDAAGRAHPGAPRNLREINNEGLIPGVAIINNVLAFNEEGGIHFSGDVNASNMLLSPVPFGRIINNTVVGDLDTGVGIRVTDYASPTAMNNIITNSLIGLEIDDTSNTTVVGGTLYGPNTTNFSNVVVGAGQNPIYLTATDKLFVAPENGNFYLESGSKAIDSSLDSLQDRSSLVAVKAPMGIAVSPILAPRLDAYGQLRVDDPTVDTSSGIGESPFVDRGAIDHVDWFAPWAVLVDPVDWVGTVNVDHLDQDPTTTVVDLVQVSQEQFVIQLQDGRVAPDPVDGTGIEDSSVSSGSFALFRDDERLTINIDYLFSYNDNSNTIYLTSLAGVWPLDATYRIELSNVQGFEIIPEDGSAYSDGDQFLLEDFAGNQAVFEFNSGFNLHVRESLTLMIPEGGGLEVIDGETFAVNDGTQQQMFEMDRNGVSQQGNIAITFEVSQSVDQIADNIVLALEGSDLVVAPVNLGGGDIHIGSTPDHALILTADTGFEKRGEPGSADEGDYVVIDNGLTHVTFEFNSDQEILDPSEVPGTHVVIQYTSYMTHDQIADLLVSEIASAGLGLVPVHLGDGSIHVGGGLSHQINTDNTIISQSGEPGVTGPWAIRIPSQGGHIEGLIEDEAQFSITDGFNSPVIFEFDSNQDANPAHRTIPFTANSTPDQIAWLIAAEIRASSLGSTMDPTVAGNSILYLGGTSYHDLDVMESTITELGSPGNLGANAVTLIEHESYTTSDVASAIATSINAADDLQAVFAVARFDTVSVEGISAVSGLEFQDSPAITDRAGNVLQPNQLDGDSSFTIKLSAGRDYADAPDSYGTTKANNGAGHLIVEGFHLGDTVDSEPNGMPSVGADGDGTDDDGVQFNTMRVGFDSSVIVTVEGIREGISGKIDSWIDWDVDGGWEATDRIADGFEVKTYPGQDSSDSTQSWCLEDQNELGRWTCNIPFDVPGTAEPRADFSTYNRTRVTTGGVASPYGFAVDGEVEDYHVAISSNPWQNGNDSRDVNNDGHVTPVDAMHGIHYLNTVGAGQLPLDYTVGNGPETFGQLDVNGDGWATAIDVLAVINRLIEMAESEAEAESGEGESSTDGQSTDNSARFMSHALHTFDTLSVTMTADPARESSLGSGQFRQTETESSPQVADSSGEQDVVTVDQDAYRSQPSDSPRHRDAQRIENPWWLDNSRFDELDGILDEIGSEVDQQQATAASRKDVFANWLN